MNRWLSRILHVVNRPESRLAAGVLLMALSVAMLVNVSLVSCEQVGGSADPRLSAGPAVPSPSVATPTAVATASGPADFRIAAIVGEPEMRVRVVTAATSVRFGGARSLRIAPSLADGRMPGAAAGAAWSGEVEIRRGPDGWVITSGGRTGQAVGEWGLFVSSSLPGQAVSVNGVAYPGRFRIVPRSDAGAQAFDVVEHVPLEDYLPGVVAKEMLTG